MFTNKMYAHGFGVHIEVMPIDIKIGLDQIYYNYNEQIYIGASHLLVLRITQIMILS